jgi:hypothetical protein
MATFSYSKIADAVLDQLWGFASVNSLKNSLRYIAEDILGDPSANSDLISNAAANSFRDQTTRATGTAPGQGGVAISSAVHWSSSSTSYTDVTDATVTLVTTGRPVLITLIHDGTSTDNNASLLVSGYSSGTTSTSTTSWFKLLRDSTKIGEWAVSSRPKDSTSYIIHIQVPGGGLMQIDDVAAGTYVYKLQGKAQTASETVQVDRSKLVAFEL